MTTYDLSSDTLLNKWARAAGMNPQEMTIEQICAAMNATNPDWTFAVSTDGRGLVATAAIASPATISLGYHEQPRCDDYGYEPNPLRHNPLTPDPADTEVRP